MLAVQSWETVWERLGASCDTFSAENLLKNLSRPIWEYGLENAYRDFGVFDGSKKYPTFRDLAPFFDKYIEDKKLQGYNVKDARDRNTNVVYPYERYDRLNGRRGLEAPDFLDNDWCLNVGNSNPAVAVTIISSIFDDVRRYLMKYPPGPGVDLRWLVIVDESRNLFRSDKSYQDIGGGLGVKDWDTKRRAYKIGRAAASQETQSFPEYAASNSPIQFFFPQTGEGAVQGSKNINLSDDQFDGAFRLQRPGSAVVRDPRIDRPFVCAIRKDSGVLLGLSSADVKAHNKLSVDSLHAAFDKVNAEGVEVKGRGDFSGLSVDERKVLEVLARKPFLKKTDLKEVVELPSRRVDTVLDQLRISGFIAHAEFVVKGPPSNYYPLLTKAHDYLELPKGARVDPKFFQHSLFMYLVACWVRSRGGSAVPEYTRSGVKGRIDVFSEEDNTAYEVQLSDTHLFRNVKKCFEGFGVSRVVIVCDRKNRIKELKKAMERRAPKGYLESILSSGRTVDYVLISSIA
jgi:hypothetical protein